MEGDSSNNELSGMIPRTVNKIFESMKLMEMNGWEYKIHVSFIEIYNENLRDLLGSMDDKTTELKIYQPINNNLNNGKCNFNILQIVYKVVNDVEVLNLKIVNVNDPEQVILWKKTI